MIFLKSQISKKLKIVAIVAILGSPLEEMVATIFWTFKIVAIEYLNQSLAMKIIKKNRSHFELSPWGNNGYDFRKILRFE